MNTSGISPAQLAELIKSDPQYKKGEPVKLIACNTGTGKNSLAYSVEYTGPMKLDHDFRLNVV